ncbi:hypothetical protein WA158_001730 [Blastocystis sp. Blastoise]
METHNQYDISSTNQKKRSVSSSSECEKHHVSKANFIFQDNQQVTIPISIFQSYPESITSLSYENLDNYLEHEDAYYIDSPSLSINTLILYMQNKITLDSLCIHDVIQLYKTLNHFFGNETKYESAIHHFLMDSLTVFLQNNNSQLSFDYFYNNDDNKKIIIHSPLNDQRNKEFLRFSELFDLLNIKTVILQYHFSEDIPYEYIYPSNLHELFPQLQTFIIKPSYEKKKDILIKKSNPHYNTIYKEYLRMYYKHYYPESYKESVRYSHEEEDLYLLNRSTICIYEIDNNGNKINDDEDNIERDDIEVCIDELIESEEDSEKSDLCIHFIDKQEDGYNDEYNSDDDDDCYSNNYEEEEEYDEDEDEIEYNDNDLKNEDYCIFEFSYIDSDKDVIPVKVQTDIPPLLKAFKEGLLDKIPNINILDFICSGSYPEYIQLFKDIISTHIFPNVTTITLNDSPNIDNDLLLQLNILSLFTRDHFPCLYIYDLCELIQNNYSKYISISESILPNIMLQLSNEILFSNVVLKDDHYYFDDVILNTIIEASKQHHFNIYCSLIAHKFNNLYKQLYDSGVFISDSIVLHYIKETTNNYIPPELKFNIFKSILFSIDYSHNNNIHIYDDVIKIEASEFCSPSYLDDYISILSSLQYNTIKNITIKETGSCCFYESKEEVIKQNTDMMYKLLSLFSTSVQSITIGLNTDMCISSILNKCIHLDLWENIQKLSLNIENNDSSLSIFQSIYNYLESNRLKKLQEININFNDIEISFELVSLFELISSIQKNKMISLPALNKFTITFIMNHINPSIKVINNILDSFPSFSYSINKPIISIIMCFTLSTKNKYEHIYNNYIINELKQDYTSTIRYLEIYVKNIDFLNTILDIVTSKKSFLYLKQISIHFYHTIDSSIIQQSLHTIQEIKKYNIIIGRY